MFFRRFAASLGARNRLKRWFLPPFQGLRWANWKINEENLPHEKMASDRAELVVEVPADGEAAVTYSVLYSWD